ncbi:MAG: SU10 major capsid protein, partial [Cetobacterium sp.]|uniref:SU10 major capsid protein n=1 Tax=Cetobacterium sp. TaxID=2071632 RepID=UPI003EE7DC36
QSYDLNGKKESFANWISNLSPTDTFFLSVTGKEKVTNTVFDWQIHSLEALKKHSWKEHEVATPEDRKPTEKRSNYTQIFRKALEVTDTADNLDTYGRNKELGYQMELAGKELKRDMEAMLLAEDQVANAGSARAAEARTTDGFFKLVAAKDAAQADTGAVVHKNTGNADVTEEQLFDLTTNLYLAGSEANVIMYHPELSSFFASLMETSSVAGGTRMKMIDNMETKLNRFVGTLVDPLGQEFKLVPNRFMPKKVIYFFNPKDWDQMVLREPTKTKLAKVGSSERYMIELELGLRHRNPFASGILKLA